MKRVQLTAILSLLLVAATAQIPAGFEKGTVNVGKFYKNPNLGVIKQGSVSDLVLISGNPLTNIENTKNIEGVMLGNRWMSKEYIEKELKKLVKQ